MWHVNEPLLCICTLRLCNLHSRSNHLFLGNLLLYGFPVILEIVSSQDMSVVNCWAVTFNDSNDIFLLISSSLFYCLIFGQKLLYQFFEGFEK